MPDIWQWDPLAVLFDGRNKENSALVILNTQLLPFHRLKLLWKNCIIRAAVDGGLNRLYGAVLNAGVDPKDFVPDYLTGDFDSVLENVKELYRSYGIKIVSTPDQDYTDFSKCLDHLAGEESLKIVQIQNYFVMVDSSGRFDQIIQNANEIIRRRQMGLNVYLLAHDSITWCLPPGSHVIRVDARILNEWCSVIPAGNSANVTTKGLKWDMSDTKLEFGGLISTSNAFSGTPEVELTTDNPVLFSVGLSSV